MPRSACSSWRSSAARRTFAEAMYPGATVLRVDTFIEESDPRASLVGKPFAQYTYDAARAHRELAEAGWQRASDGRLLGQAGQQMQLTVRGTAGGDSDKENAVVSQSWRQLGIDLAAEILPRSLVSDVEVRAKFSAFEITAVVPGIRTLDRWDSRIAPTSERRFVGNNRGSYINPEYDRIIDRLKTTLDVREQGLLLRDGGEILARDLPALPLYYHPDVAAVRRGVRALVDDFHGGGNLSRNAHLWDRE